MLKLKSRNKKQINSLPKLKSKNKKCKLKIIRLKSKLINVLLLRRTLNTKKAVTEEKLEAAGPLVKRA